MERGFKKSEMHSRKGIGSRYQPHSCTATVMPSEATPNLSVLELLQGLNDKLTLESKRVEEIHFPHGVASVTTLKTEVSTSRSIHPNYSCGQI